MMKIRIGVVKYVNAQPLIHGLDKERGVQIISAAPSALTGMLLNGEVDVALLSSIECFRHPELQILPEIGVCSEGPIRSIRLFHRIDPRLSRKVALDKSSRSAAALTRIAFKDFYGRPEVNFFEIEPTTEPESVTADAVLLIGDVALLANAPHWPSIDLGELWTERTGLPFVYAVWTCLKGSRADQFLPVLLRARDRGMPERHKVAQQAAKQLKLPEAALIQYLTRNLRYQLGERELKGLERFRDLAADHGLCQKLDLPFMRVKMQTV